MDSLIDKLLYHSLRSVLTGLKITGLMDRYQQIEVLSKVVSFPQLYHILKSERVFEYAWILQELTAIFGERRDIHVLEVGTGKSGFVNTLCALGYQVTGVDYFSPPFHNYPTYKYVQGGILDLDTGIRYDAITCISVIEHVGLDRGQDGDDIHAMIKMNELLKSSGILLLTTHYGASYVVNRDLRWRTYDDEHLERLLAPFHVLKINFWSNETGFWLPVSRDVAKTYHSTVCAVLKKK